MFKKLKGIRTLPDAIRHAKRLCRCTRTSFEGVSYFENGEWVPVTWLEVDRGRALLYSAPVVKEG